MKLNLTNQQISKIRKGQNFQIKPHQVGSGMDYNIHPSLQRKMSSSMKTGKGFRVYGGDIMMNNDMMGMEGGRISLNRGLKKLGIKKDVNRAVKQAAPILRAVNRGLETAGLNNIQEMIIDQAVDFLPVPAPVKTILSNKLSQQADKYISGAGIRKTLNRGLKKAGIKKDFYNVANQVNKRNINKALNYTNDILEEAGYDDVQSMAVRKVAKDPRLQNAIRNVADDALYDGAGIRKTLNRGLKKAGIKKDFYNVANQVNKRNINKALNYTNDILEEAGYDDVQSMAVRKVAKDPRLQNAIRTVADDALYGGAINPYLPTKYLGRKSMSGGSIRPNNPEVYSDNSHILKPLQAGFKAVPLDYVDFSYKPNPKSTYYGKFTKFKYN